MVFIILGILLVVFIYKVVLHNERVRKTHEMYSSYIRIEMF